MTLAIDPMNDLKVEVQVPTPGLQNLIKNPDGALGGYGWESPVANTGVSRQGVDLLNFYTNATQATYFQSELLPITANWYAVARYTTTYTYTNTTIKASFQWYTSAKVWISGTVQTAATANGTFYVPAAQAPANAAYVKLRLDMYTSGGNAVAGAAVYMKNVMVAKSSSSTGFGSIKTNYVLNASGVSGTTNTWSGFTNAYVNGTMVPTNISTQAGVGGRTAFKISDYTPDIYGTSAQGMQANIPTIPSPGSWAHYSVDFWATRSGLRGLYFIDWYDGSGTKVGNTNGASTDNLPTNTWTKIYGNATVPAGATNAKIRVYLSRMDGTYWATDEYHFIDRVFMTDGYYYSPPADYFDGSTTDTATVDYAWSGTAWASMSTATIASAGFDYQPPYAWLPITGSVNSMDIDRETMNVGLASIVIKDNDLDPSTSNKTLTPGKMVRISANDAGTFKNLFVGKISNAHVDYDKKKVVNATVKATITITAQDAMADLANQGENRSVAALAELPYILEGKGVPWNVDGVTDHYTGTPTIPVVNDNLSIADQVVITRDTNRAQAWIDKDGVLQVTSAQPWGTHKHYFADYVDAGTTEYMVNGNFESTGTGPFTIYGGGSIARDAAAAYSGGYGLRGTANGTGTLNFDSYNVISVPRPGLYEVSYKYRTNTAGAMMNETGDASFNTGALAANTWYTASYVVETDTTNVDLDFYLYKDTNYNNTVAGSTLDIDDVTVKPVKTDAYYSDIDIDWDTDRIVNSVQIKHLLTNAEGNAEEYDAGIYQNASSVATYGPKQATYTIVGSGINYQTYANGILSNNATPSIRVNSLRMPVKDAASLSKAIALDLCDGVYVSFDDKVDNYYRIASIKHSISVDGWYVDITFDTSNSNALPQYTPAPPVVTETVYDTGWVQPTLVNNWGYYAGTGSNWGPLRVRRIGKQVTMYGLITKTVGSTAEAVCQLPADVRPPYHQMFAQINNSTDPARLDVQSDGWVVFPGGVPNVAFVSVCCTWMVN